MERKRDVLRKVNFLKNSIIVYFLIVLSVFSMFANSFINITVSADSNSYYVSTTGSDSNSGTLSSPWRHVNYACGKLNAGDTLIIKSGTYNERVVFSGKSGTSSAWITIKSETKYGAVIDGTGYIFSGYNSGLFDMTSVAYIVIDGITLRESDRNGIVVHESHDVTIQNCHTLYTDSAGIRTDNNDKIENPTYNIIITNNWIQYSHRVVDQESMSICRTRNFQITYNLIDETNNYIGIDMKDACYDGICAYNEVANTNSGNIYIDVAGEDTTLSSYNIDIYNNYCHGADTGCKIGSEWSGDSVYDINVYNNIFVNGVYNFKYTDQPAGTTSADFHDINFYNNVFVAGKSCLRLYVVPAGYSNYYEDMIIRNNIFKGPTAIDRNSNSQPQEELIVDHNFFVTGTNKGVTNDISSLTGPEPWVSSTDYHLKSNSTCINAGSNNGVTWNFDYEGSTRIQDGTVDIGSYEYFSETQLEINQINFDEQLEINQIILTKSNQLDTESDFGWINITAVVTDDSEISSVKIIINCPDESIINVTMKSLTSDIYYYNTSTTFSNYGEYNYHIYAQNVNGDIKISSTYNFLMPPNWDINQDRKCDKLDYISIATHYTKTGHKGWIREDVDNNGKINVLDFVSISKHNKDIW